MKRELAFAAVVLTGALLFAQKAPAPEGDPDSRKAEAKPSPWSAASTRTTARGDGATTVLRRDASGQFHITAQVNGEDVRFMVDTGADVVALTVDDAQRLGIDADPEQFQPIGRTASGVGYGLPIRLDHIEIEGHEMTDVQAVVMDGLGTNLLGQSVLRRLGQLEMRGDTMTIRTGV